MVVIGRGGRHIDSGDAQSHIAGYTVGQDISERTVQWQGQPAQFNLGKSFAGFAPTGPALVTLDEFADPDRLRISCTLTDAAGRTQTMQDGSTEQLIFSVPDIVSRLSEVVELLPGDLDLHRDPAGHRRGDEAAAVSRGRGRARHRDRGHRRTSPSGSSARGGPMILVTAAGGNQGRHLIPKLIEAGLPVRACVRSEPSARLLRAAG